MKCVLAASTLWFYLLTTASPADDPSSDDPSSSVQYFVSKGVRLAYLNEGSGPAVVYLHGMTGSRENHRPLRDKLIKAGFRVIALDARGHGLSERPREKNAYGVEMVHDIARLLKHLKIDKTHIVGYSMGGDIANKFREIYPDKLKSVVLGGVGRGVTKGWTSNKNFSFVEFARSMENGHGMKFLLRQPGAVRPGTISEDQVEKLNTTLMRDTDNKIRDGKAYAALLRAYHRLEVTDKSLRGNKIPTMSVVGQFDAEKPTVDEWKGRFNNITFVEIKGRNHFQAANTEQFRTAVVKFFEQHR